MNIRTTVVCCVALIAACPGGAAVGEDSSPGAGRAIVTGLKGEAQANQRPLKQFSLCHDGDAIEVASGGQLTLVLTRTLYEVVVTGPARLRLSNDALILISGKPPQQRDLFPGRSLQLKEGLIEQASTRTRGDSSQAALRQLRPNGTLADPAPEFQWEAAETGSVSFTLFDAQATPLYTRDNVESGFRLPSAVQLHPRQHYTWVIAGRRVDGREVRAQGNFIVADGTQLNWRRQLGNCAQSASKQVACALLLEQAGFRGEAEHYWQGLEKSAPNHALIRAYHTLEQ